MGKSQDMHSEDLFMEVKAAVHIYSTFPDHAYTPRDMLDYICKEKLYLNFIRN